MNLTIKHLPLALLAAACIATTAQAGVNNGDFSAGLSGWSISGNVAVDSASTFGTPAGGASAQAVMGTAATGGYLFGGSVVSAATLETFSGLAGGTLTGLGGVVGSALGQLVSTAAGESIGFSWNFMSDEPQNSPANDLAFMVLDGTLYTLTSVQTAVFQGSSLSPMLDETGYASYSTGALAAGSHVLVFGVMDAPDSLGASALAISGVNVAAVPEPGSWALMLGGIAAVGGLVRRRL